MSETVIDGVVVLFIGWLGRLLFEWLRKRYLKNKQKPIEYGGLR